MNKVILVALIAGTAVAQYPSPNYLPANRGADVSSVYSQRGGQYASGPGSFGSRINSGYQSSDSGSYSSSNSNAGSYSSTKSGSSSLVGGGYGGPSAGGYGGAGPTSGGYSGAPASRGYPGANQGSYGRVGPTNGNGAGYNGGASGYNGGSSGYNGNRGASRLNGGASGYNGGASGYNGGASGYNGGASGYNGGASGYNGGRGAYNAQDDLAEPAKYEFKYDVLAPEYYNEFGHAEQRDGDYTTGSYYVLLPDGRRQLVEYTADQDGYKPRISYTEAAAGAGAYNRQGTGYNGQGSAYNGQGSAYNGQGSAYNGQGSAYNGQGSAYNGQGPANRQGYNGQAYQPQQAGGYSSSGSRTGGY